MDFLKPSRSNRTDAQTDGRTDGQTNHYRTPAFCEALKTLKYQKYAPIIYIIVRVTSYNAIHFIITYFMDKS